jgi:hypothetical protein
MKITYSFELAQPNKVANLLAIPAFAVEASVDIEAEMYGNYRPATWDYPAEYPELDITYVDNLVVTLYCETQNIAFDVKTTVKSFSSSELNDLLEPHWNDIENYLWEVYHDNQEWN